MRFTLTIDCDNEAFEEDRNGAVANVLRDLAGRVERGEMDIGDAVWAYRTVLDENGNGVGHASFVR